MSASVQALLMAGAAGSVSYPAFLGARGLVGGGYTTTDSNVIDYWDISGSPSNAADFGDLTSARNTQGCLSNGTRAVWGGGYIAATVSTMDYVTIASTGNAVSLGSLSQSRDAVAGASGTTRGLFGGGSNGSGSNYNVIDYITIATAPTHNATDFGDLTSQREACAAVSSETRVVFVGGATSTTMDYVTTASAGNATSFGTLGAAYQYSAGATDGTYGVIGGRADASTDMVRITIATTGNGTDHGDLSAARSRLAAVSNGALGMWAGGYTGSGNSNVIDSSALATAANCSDFGDLSVTRRYCSGASGT